MTKQDYERLIFELADLIEEMDPGEICQDVLDGDSERIKVEGQATRSMLASYLDNVAKADVSDQTSSDPRTRWQRSREQLLLFVKSLTSGQGQIAFQHRSMTSVDKMSDDELIDFVDQLISSGEYTLDDVDNP